MGSSSKRSRGLLETARAMAIRWRWPPERSAGRLPANVRKFGTCTVDLEQLADWLDESGVKTVAMESTGVYWIPLFELLERRGFEVFLVDPRQTRQVAGRPKTDVLDCQWIRRLHACGLLAASFRPADEVCVLRSYLPDTIPPLSRVKGWLHANEAAVVAEEVNGQRMAGVIDRCSLRFNSVIAAAA